MKRNGNGKLLRVPPLFLPPSEGESPSKVPTLPVLLRNRPVLLPKAGLKGFFGSRQPSTSQSLPTRQRSTKTENANATLITTLTLPCLAGRVVMVRRLSSFLLLWARFSRQTDLLLLLFSWGSSAVYMSHKFSDINLILEQ